MTLQWKRQVDGSLVDATGQYKIAKRGKKFVLLTKEPGSRTWPKDGTKPATQKACKATAEDLARRPEPESAPEPPQPDPSTGCHAEAEVEKSMASTTPATKPDRRVAVPTTVLGMMMFPATLIFDAFARTGIAQALTGVV